jgi:hypothetical protein
MKKTIVLLLLTAILISSCSLLSGEGVDETPLAPTATMMPTATPDPCAPENLEDALQPLIDLINTYRDTALVASITQQVMMPIPLLELQENRRTVQNFDVPECQEQLKAAALEYMVASFNVFGAFATYDQTVPEEKIEIENALNSLEETLWQNVLFQVNILMVDAGLREELEVLPSISPEGNNFLGISISNDTNAGINVRGLPDLNADIIASLEPGMQAIGLARTEAGDWVQVNLDGVIGWVFAETISSDEPLDSLPVFEPVQ